MPKILIVEILTLVVPHPETVNINPDAGSNSSVVGGRLMG